VSSAVKESGVDGRRARRQNKTARRVAGRGFVALESYAWTTPHRPVDRVVVVVVKVARLLSRINCLVRA